MAHCLSVGVITTGAGNARLVRQTGKTGTLPEGEQEARCGLTPLFPNSGAGLAVDSTQTSIKTPAVVGVSRGRHPPMRGDLVGLFLNTGTTPPWESGVVL